jgi:hypothetical protein
MPSQHQPSKTHSQFLQDMITKAGIGINQQENRPEKIVPVKQTAFQ